MGFVTWVAIIAIVLVAIGLGVGVFFSGLIRGAEIVGERISESTVVREAQDFVEDRVDAGSSDRILVVTTDEATYDAGEPVTITVKNIGDRTLAFPDASLGLEIVHAGSGQKYNVPSAKMITELAPGESKEITWNEEGAPAGDYIATVHTTPEEEDVSAQVRFMITG